MTKLFTSLEELLSSLEELLPSLEELLSSLEELLPSLEELLSSLEELLSWLEEELLCTESLGVVSVLDACAAHTFVFIYFLEILYKNTPLNLEIILK